MPGLARPEEAHLLLSRITAATRRKPMWKCRASAEKRSSGITLAYGSAWSPTGTFVRSDDGMHCTGRRLDM